MLAMEPEPRVPGGTAAARLQAWQDVPPLYDDGATSLRGVADEAYLRLLVQGAGARTGATTLIGFDILDPEAGELRWPNAVRPDAPPPRPAVGLEFALVLEDGGLRLLAHDRYAPWRLEAVGRELPGSPEPPPSITDPMPGLFSGRVEQRRNRPYQPLADDDGEYWVLPVVTNRRRFTGDSTEIAAFGYHRGLFREGLEPDGDWDRLAHDALEIRVPWGLLNFTDPSGRRVLYEEKRFLRPLPDVFGTTTVDGIRIVAVTRADGAGTPGGWRPLPASGAAHDVARFNWPPWDEPRWRTRRRPVFDSLRAVFTELEQGGQ
jgi:hypothetical protein